MERGTPTNPRRQGFSLVELLVVVAVVGLLIAIGVPAIQQTRESARRVECRNHLKQFGVALQNHHGQFGRLPQDGFNGYGIGAFLLPQLEERALYDRLAPRATALPSPSEAREGMEDVILRVFRCASDFSTDRLAPSRFGRSNVMGTTDLFSVGLPLAHVVDGESQTIAAGETVAEHGWALPGTASGDSPPNADGRFGSRHAGGAHFVFCDGAVRFISQSIDSATFRALCTPAGGEPVGEF